MSTFTTKDSTQIYYKDWGTGQPVVFSHGWPLSSDAFEDQMFYFASRGYRCIAHDRRGSSTSSISGMPSMSVTPRAVAKLHAISAVTAPSVWPRPC